MTIDELIDNFEFLGDWEERFTYLLDLGRKLPPMDKADMVEENRVHGCQATVYLKARAVRNGQVRLHLSATADAFIVNGLIAVLLLLFDGKTPGEILQTDAPAVLRKLDLEEHLSPTRRNGLHSMLKRIRTLATLHAG